ncbi:GntR family transcriptional regulator [Kibdelosporangium persicum]|uniref:Transcriptional regulator, GntR family with UTRA sensor domain n=1 Tax=Kibdelosporangium persicum TaxID=2698649 RepID=A0ABX2F8E2_9PSEU|nr:GntR family transcriptional regulator [Kibdelosporangium persicum]NRN67614.1 Transcriptional regulator, GntR family with UTRA sensor domain [Kibdelosporangium persicum]
MSDRVGRLKHERIVEQLAKEIQSGRLAHGARLPGENALAARFSVSRNTVRQALTQLGNQGLIATHSGKGSFVTFDDRPIDDRLGWTRALADQGVRTAVVRVDLVEDVGLAEWVGGLESAEFVAVDRLRSTVDGSPVSFERSRVPAIGTLRELPSRGLEGSLYDELRAVGLVPDSGEEWCDLARLSAADAQLLGRPEGERFLRTRRLTRDANGQFVEHVESLLDPDRFRLHLVFGG